jgi:hypothetical protein
MEASSSRDQHRWGSLEVPCPLLVRKVSDEEGGATERVGDNNHTGGAGLPPTITRSRTTFATTATACPVWRKGLKNQAKQPSLAIRHRRSSWDGVCDWRDDHDPHQQGSRRPVRSRPEELADDRPEHRHRLDRAPEW